VQRAGARWGRQDRQAGQAGRTGNAQAPNNRNAFVIKALKPRVQTIRSVVGRFALHVFFALSSSPVFFAVETPHSSGGRLLYRHCVSTGK
jgi:hypothetical protein